MKKKRGKNTPSHYKLIVLFYIFSGKMEFVCFKTFAVMILKV